MKHLPYEDILRKPGLLSPEKTEWSNLLKGADKERGEGLFIGNGSDGTRSTGYTLKGGKYRFDIRKNFFTGRAVRHRNRLPWEVVKAPLRAVFKARWGKAPLI